MTEPIVLTHLARIRTVTTARNQALFQILQQRFGYDGTPESVYNFDAEISNDLIDSHYTHMSTKTLKNYAEDSERGIAFLKGHDWRSLPIGYSLTGRFEDEAGKQRVISGFYTVLGLQDTNDFVHRMKTGLVRDVSVGFGGGSYTCDICGRDYWDWDCRHVPGLKYEEKRGDETVTVISTFTIDDARLSEVSAVFDGSTPDAMILRAQRVAEAGGLTPQQIDILENRYRVKLPTKKTIAITNDKGHYKWDVTTEERKMEDKDLERIKTVLVNSKTITAEQASTLDDTTLASVVESFGERFKVSEAQAEEGRQYRKDLIDSAIESGVRAHGNDFDATMYRTTLEGLPLASVKRMAADWEKTAKAALPAGRTSVDLEQRVPIVQEFDEAYA